MKVLVIGAGGIIGQLPRRIRAKIRIDKNGCWIWTGAKIKRGYGTVRWEGKTQVAHRAIYKICVGPVPEGLELDHVCKNTSCVNPDKKHLEPVTHTVNIARSNLHLIHGGKTHCVNGHSYSGNNLVVTNTKDRKGLPTTERRCRICGLAAAKRWRDTHKCAS